MTQRLLEVETLDQAEIVQVAWSVALDGREAAWVRERGSGRRARSSWVR
jgi:hypothetical protein